MVKLEIPMMQVDVKALFALWNDSSVTQRDLCQALGVTPQSLRRLKQRYGLPHRHFAGKVTDDDIESPTQEEIAERKAAIQASWSPGERRSRAVHKAGRWRPPAYMYDGRNVTFSG